MITSLEFIIVSLVISICVSAIVGTLVYCILKKTYDAEIKNFKEDFRFIFGELDKFEETYFKHMSKYH